MALNVRSLNCSGCKAPCAGGFKMCARLPCCGIDVYQYSGTTQSVQTDESLTDNTFVFHHKRYEGVNRQTVVSELNKYRTKCTTCRCIINRARTLLEELDLVNMKEVFAICEHCQKSIEVPCKRCVYIVKKFQCCNAKVEERHRRFTEWLSKIKMLLQSILNTSHANQDLVRNAADLQELERLLREIYPPTATRSTPKIQDWTSVTSASLYNLYENREILRKILERMKDESLWMTCSEQGPCMFGDIGLSRLALDRPPRPALSLVSPRKSPNGKSVSPKKSTVSKVPANKVTRRSRDEKEESVLRAGKSTSIDEETDGLKKIPPKEIRGIFTYQLSDKKFIDNGWTHLPTLETLRLYDTYKMTPVKGHDDWIVLNRDKGVMYYDTGEILAVFKNNGAVTWFYKNRMVALVYNRPEEANDNRPCMYVLYSFEVDMRKKQSILAKFDYRGNGVVYDNQGRERLKYNQNSGEVLDKKLGAPGRWLWHNLNEPPVYETKFVDTYEKNPDPALTQIIHEHEKMDKKGRTKTDREEDMMLEIELQNYAKTLEKKCKATFQTYKIQMKSLKINEFFSLKVLHQSHVFLRFSDGLNRFKLDLGLMIHCDQVLGRDSVFLYSEMTPKICHPDWSWSTRPVPSVGTLDQMENLYECFN